MKSYKITFGVTCSDDYFNHYTMDMKNKIESGKAKEEFLLPEDKVKGIENVEITFEELPL